MSRIQPRLEFGPDCLRKLSEPETSEIVPSPLTRESMPVIVNTSGVPAALGFEIVIMPVVQGNPADVAAFVSARPGAAENEAATSPVVFGALTTTLWGVIGAGPPGVFAVKPTGAPAAASDAGRL